jgi:cytochrome c oxidase assembly protein subunit 11
MTNAPQSAAVRRKASRDIVVACSAGAFAGLMLGAAYAAVPLYDWFCRTTGFGGTPLVSTTAPAETLERTITVRFDANMAPGLPWKFEPEQNAVKVKIGEVVTAFYTVTNTVARETVGQATYNVTPQQSAPYFNKINCFCFTDQRMAPGEKREMPVVFYIDPAIAKDAEHRSLDTITLSYTFFPVKQPARPVAAVSSDKATSRN